MQYTKVHVAWVILPWPVDAAAGGVRDVTARYAKEYHTRVKAQRVKDEWWNTALAKHAPKDMVCS